MDEVERIVAERNFLIINNDFDGTFAQLTLHSGDVGGTLLCSSKETPVIGARLQNHEAGPVGNIPIKPTEHGAGRVERDPSVDDFGVDSPGLQQQRQPSGVRALVSYIPALGVASADGNNSQRQRFTRTRTGQDHKPAEQKSDSPTS